MKTVLAFSALMFPLFLFPVWLAVVCADAGRRYAVARR